MLTLLFSLIALQAGGNNYWYPAKDPVGWVNSVVYPIIRDDDRKLFLSLKSEESQRIFADLFWRYVGKRTGLGPRYRDMYYERVQMVLERYGNTTEDRANIILVHGEPDEIFRPNCGEVFHPMEFWIYGYIEGIGRGVVILFVQEYGLGSYRLYEPFSGVKSIMTIKGEHAMDPWMECFDGYETKKLFNIASATLSDFQNVLRLRRASWVVDNEKSGESNYSTVKKMMSFYSGKNNLKCDTFVFSKVFDGSFVRFDIASIVEGGDLFSDKFVNFDAMLEVIDNDGNAEITFYAFTFDNAPKYPIVVSGRFRRGERKVKMFVRVTGRDDSCISELFLDDGL